MNERKRLLSLVLAAVLVIGMMPTTVFAEETTPSTVTTVPTTVATEPVTVAEVPTTAATEPSTVATDPTTTATEPTTTETTVPETTVPETTVPETTVPETTVPETTVPETTVPETTVPETTVPETTVTTEPTEETTEATEETEPELTFAENLLAVETLSDLLIEICKEENMDALLALTAEEIASLRAKVNALYDALEEPTAQDDTDKTDILDTLAILPNAPVENGADAATIEEIAELMDEFVNIMNTIPDVEEISAFVAAVKDYGEIHALFGRDMFLPDVEVAEFEMAYRAFAEAMGYDPSAIEIIYPGSPLEDDLQNSVSQAKNLIDYAQMLFEALEKPQILPFSLLESEPPTSVADIQENYSEAEKKLNAILEANPDLAVSKVATYAINLGTNDLGTTITTVDTVKENIQMSLFNYGPLINTQVSGYSLFPFTHSEGSYGWAVDSTGNNPAASAGGWPMLRTTLDSTYKFPYITQDKGGVIKAGSLGHLFDPNYSGAGRISTATYQANILGDQNPYQYRSVYFPVVNDGSGTGLFQKEGDYFVYDSGKNAAWYNPNTQKFEVYNYVVRPAYTTFSTADTNGNFLPFNQGHTAGKEDYQAGTYSKKYSYIDASGKTVETTSTVAITDRVTTKPSNALTAYRLDGSSRSTEVDLWFGLQMEFDFNQPRDGKKSGAPMVFEFLGDDDVFVYIDDVLILDIGGTHGAQTGKINFATGVVTNPSSYGQYGTSGKSVSTLYALMKAAKGNDLDESQFIDSDGDGVKDTFKNFTQHNLKFYYLERGGNISYCRLKFNMDPLPTGNVTLQKQVDGINESIADDQTYKFTITATDANGKAVTGMTYQITSGDTTGSVMTVSSGGEINLKANEIATFTNLTAGTTVKFTEVGNDKTNALIWTLNGQIQNNSSATATVSEDSTQAARFVCTNTRKTTSLTVEKKMDGDEYSTSDQYEMNVTIGGKPYTGAATKTGADGATTTKVQFVNGKINLLANEKIVITGIPTGLTYAVSETTPANTVVYSYDAPMYKVNNAEMASVSGTINEETHVVVTNTLHLLLGNLTITKNGISDLDDHEYDGINNQEQQSTIYTVKGTSHSGVDVDMEVVIVDNGSVTIKDIPVGNYTVTEKVNWSWRYDATEATKTVTVTGGNTATADFQNNRNRIYWLSGDNYALNLFDGDLAN